MLLSKLLNGFRILLYGLNLYFWVLVTLSVLHWVQDNGDTSIEPLNAFFAIILTIINWGLSKLEKNRSFLLNNQQDPKKYFPDIDFSDRLNKISIEIQKYIEDLNIDSNWSFENYTEIDAEVEIIKQDSKLRKLSKLTDAVQKNRNNTFLILGEPGSGKSVSLRKLCYLFAQQTAKSKVIPIYINLKEWQFEGNPTTESLKLFVIDYLKGLDRPELTKYLFEKVDGEITYFEKLYSYGFLYFIFDSFDEIPQVLTSHDKSVTIVNVTKTISRFIEGSKTNGILASRYYKLPERFISKITLRLLPFDDLSISKTLIKYGINDDMIKHIFLHRPDLIQLLGNPFSLMLFVNYFVDNKKLPINQVELYESFTNKSLQNKIQEYGFTITLEDSINQLEKMAKIMFDNEKGFEISISSVKGNKNSLLKVIELLKIAKLGRGLVRDKNVFGFVHRRFVEYFMVKNMLDKNINISLDTIPNMGQYRDSLVLFAELATEKEAQAIANFCIKKILSEPDPLKKESLNSLAFLVDSFQNRLGDIITNLIPLFKHCIALLDKSNDILVLKNYVEILKLMDEKCVHSNGLTIFKWNNIWLNETVIRCSRRLSTISDDFKYEIKSYITNLDFIYFFKVLPNLLFSFSLNNAFISGKRYCYIKILDLIYFLVLLLIFTYYEVVVVRYLGSLYINSNSATFGFVIVSTFFLILLAFTSGLKLNMARYLFFIMFIGNIIIDIKSVGIQQIVQNPFYLFVFLLSISPLSIRFLSTDILKINILRSDFIIFFTAISIVIINLFVPINIYIGILCSISFLLFYYWKIAVDLLRYRKVFRTKPETREDIYQVLMKELKSDYFKNKYVIFLENNIFSVSGNWPDRQLFIINNEQEFVSRLAKLEEKWTR
jgi:hypothetical protein